jgi:hypothetical protein
MTQTKGNKQNNKETNTQTTVRKQCTRHLAAECTSSSAPARRAHKQALLAGNESARATKVQKQSAPARTAQAETQARSEQARSACTSTECKARRAQASTQMFLLRDAQLHREQSSVASQRCIASHLAAGAPKLLPSHLVPQTCTTLAFGFWIRNCASPNVAVVK